MTNEETEKPKIEKNEIEYAFDEDQYIQELKNHIDSTITCSLSQNRVQSTNSSLMQDMGRGSALHKDIKYAQRYGKKWS